MSLVSHDTSSESTDSRVTTHQSTQVLSIASGGGEMTVVKTAFYSEPETIAQAQLAHVSMRLAGVLVSFVLERD